MDINQILNFALWGNTFENYLWFSGIILLSIVFKRLISKKLGQVVFKIFKRNKGDSFLNLDQFFDLMIKNKINPLKTIV